MLLDSQGPVMRHEDVDWLSSILELLDEVLTICAEKEEGE